MDNILVLLTKTFPYDSGEEFIENEISSLSKSFSKVIIFATAVGGQGKQTRFLPQNVKSFAIKGIDSKWVRYFFNIIGGIRYISNIETKKEIQKANQITAKLATVYFANRCRGLYKKISTLVDQNKLIKYNDNIFLYSYWFSDLPYVGVLLKRKYNNRIIKLVSRAHGYDLYEERNIARTIPFRGVVLNYIDKVFTCSQDGEKYLKNKYPVFADKIETSYLGTVDCGLAKIRNNKLYHIVSCSSIIPLKRISIIVDAVKILENKSYPVLWTCIGDGPLLEEIKNEVAKKIKKSTVNFTGRLNNSEVLSIYKSKGVDLFVNVSENEGLPVSIMEAISFGIPVVATNVGGTSEIVKNDVTGILMNKDLSPKQLADYIDIALLKDWDTRLIRKFWETNFDAKKNYLSFIKKVLE